MIKGISPKIEKLLKSAGIKTYSSLASAKVTSLKSVVNKAGSLPYKCDPTTWSKQAKMAGAGNWSALVKWQRKLKLELV